MYPRVVYGLEVVANWPANDWVSQTWSATAIASNPAASGGLDDLAQERAQAWSAALPGCLRDVQAQPHGKLLKVA